LMPNRHTVALKADGTVWVWGKNSYGQLGNGTTMRSTVPIQVEGLEGIVAIQAGMECTIAYKMTERYGHGVKMILDNWVTELLKTY